MHLIFVLLASFVYRLVTFSLSQVNSEKEDERTRIFFPKLQYSTARRVVRGSVVRERRRGAFGLYTQTHSVAHTHTAQTVTESGNESAGGAADLRSDVDFSLRELKSNWNEPSWARDTVTKVGARETGQESAR